MTKSPESPVGFGVRSTTKEGLANPSPKDGPPQSETKAPTDSHLNVHSQCGVHGTTHSQLTARLPLGMLSLVTLLHVKRVAGSMAARRTGRGST